MSFAKDRIEGVGRAARGTLLGFIGIALTLFAVVAFVYSMWNIIAIFVLAMWLTFKAALAMIAAGSAAMMAYGCFTAMGGYEQRRRIRTKTVETTVPTKLDPRYQGKWGNITFLSERQK